MTTKLTKPVRRKSNEIIRDRSKRRAIIVTIYPAGYIGLRLEGTRKEETMNIETAYYQAIRSRVAVEKMEKAKAKKRKKEGK